jgi:hypothetical protein
LPVPPCGVVPVAPVAAGLPGVEKPPDWLSYFSTIWLNLSVSCCSVSV